MIPDPDKINISSEFMLVSSENTKNAPTDHRGAAETHISLHLTSIFNVPRTFKRIIVVIPNNIISTEQLLSLLKQNELLDLAVLYS